MLFTPTSMKGKKGRADLTPWEPTTYFNERIHANLVGPLKSITGNKWIMVSTCAYFKLVEITPLPNKEAPTVAAAFYKHWVCRYGVPKLLVSDGGREFDAKVLDELAKLLGMKKVVNSPHHPQSNSQVERFNRELKAYLTDTVDETTLNWERYLPSLQMAHNSALNRSTMHTPNFLVYNHELRLPGSLDRPNYSPTAAGEAYRMWHLTNQMVIANNEAARVQYAKYYNAHFKTDTFQYRLGMKLLVRWDVGEPGTNPKFHRPWRGVFYIIEVLGRNNVRVMRHGAKKAYKVHTNRVKNFHEVEDLNRPEVDYSYKENNLDYAGPVQTTQQQVTLPTQQMEVTRPDTRSSRQQQPQQQQRTAVPAHSTNSSSPVQHRRQSGGKKHTASHTTQPGKRDTPTPARNESEATAPYIMIPFPPRRPVIRRIPAVPQPLAAQPLAAQQPLPDAPEVPLPVGEVLLQPQAVVIQGPLLVAEAPQEVVLVDEPIPTTAAAEDLDDTDNDEITFITTAAIQGPVPHERVLVDEQLHTAADEYIIGDPESDDSNDNTLVEEEVNNIVLSQPNIAPQVPLSLTPPLNTTLPLVSPKFQALRQTKQLLTQVPSLCHQRRLPTLQVELFQSGHPKNLNQNAL
jgi:hypothetical protein